MTYHAVLAADALEADQSKLVTINDVKLIVAKSDDQFFAFENRCTHDNEALVGGRIRKCSIVCPWHGARFSLKNGNPFGPPAFEPITTYPVRVVDGMIEVSLKAKS